MNKNNQSQPAFKQIIRQYKKSQNKICPISILTPLYHEDLQVKMKTNILRNLLAVGEAIFIKPSPDKIAVDLDKNHLKLLKTFQMGHLQKMSRQLFNTMMKDKLNQILTLKSKIKFQTIQQNKQLQTLKELEESMSHFKDRDKNSKKRKWSLTKIQKGHQICLTKQKSQKILGKSIQQRLDKKIENEIEMENQFDLFVIKLTEQEEETEESQSYDLMHKFLNYQKTCFSKQEQQRYLQAPSQENLEKNQEYFSILGMGQLVSIDSSEESQEQKLFSESARYFALLKQGKLSNLKPHHNLSFIILDQESFQSKSDNSQDILDL